MSKRGIGQGEKEEGKNSIVTTRDHETVAHGERRHFWLKEGAEEVEVEEEVHTDEEDNNGSEMQGGAGHRVYPAPARVALAM